MGFLMKSGRRTSYFRIYGFSWAENGQIVVNLKEYTSKDARDSGDKPIGRRDVLVSFPDIYRAELACVVNIPEKQVKELSKNAEITEKEAENIIASKIAHEKANLALNEVYGAFQRALSAMYDVLSNHPEIDTKKAC